MQKRLITILFVIFFFSFSYSQNISDSLTIVLKNCKSDTAKIQVLNELTLSLYNTNPELCFEYANQAYNISKKEGYTKHIAKTLNALAVASWAKGNYDKSLEYLFEKLTINKKENDKHDISATYRNIAIIYKETERYELALDFLYKALEINKQENFESEIAGTYNMLGIIYDDINNYSKAREYWKKAINIYKKRSEHLKIAYVKNNLGNLFKNNEEYDSALIYYNESLMICKKFEDNWSITNVLLNIADIYVLENKVSSADKFYKEALDTALKYKFTRLEMSIMHSLVQLDTLKKDYESAFDKYTQYILLKDSIFSQEKEKTISELEIKYETKKKEKENQLLKKSEKIKSSIVRTVSIILFLSAILLFVLWILIRRKRKTNKSLNRENIRITEKNNKLKQTYAELHKSNKKIKEAHKDITDNIKYAKTIQNALLTSKELIDSYFNDYFLLFKPKDQVSGDFYYINKINNNLIFAVADCTGHGVPGGFLTILGITYLHEIVRKEDIQNVGDALNLLRQRIKNTFKAFGSENYNGMDIAICAINQKTNILQYSGAYNPLWIIRNDKLTEYKATRNPIGFYPKEISFIPKEIQLQNNDIIYLFTDGYPDQINNENKKFSKRQLKDVFLEIHTMPLNKQKKHLVKNLKHWRQKQIQIDDITILGIKWGIKNL